MSAKPGNRRNRITASRVCLYGVMTALCIVFGYLESLVPLAFIAPGIKLGLSNAAVLLLAAFRDTKGAIFVNIARIVLSAMLFGSPFSLLFSLAGGLASVTAVLLLRRLSSVSVIGMSIAGGAIHNLSQLIVSLFIVGRGAVYYLPLLLLCGGASGALVGTAAVLILKKIKTNGSISCIIDLID